MIEAQNYIAYLEMREEIHSRESCLFYVIHLNLIPFSFFKTYFIIGVKFKQNLGILMYLFSPDRLIINCHKAIAGQGCSDPVALISNVSIQTFVYNFK